jgi:hypothetical protein
MAFFLERLPRRKDYPNCNIRHLPFSWLKLPFVGIYGRSRAVGAEPPSYALAINCSARIFPPPTTGKRISKLLEACQIVRRPKIINPRQHRPDARGACLEISAAQKRIEPNLHA